MKISAIPSQVSIPVTNPDGTPKPGNVESYRSLKMATNRTPLPNQFELPIPLQNSETTATVEATQPLSPQLALLAKQRRALQVKEREIQQREKALSQTSKVDMIDKAKFQADPLSVMLDNGITYDQLTEAIIKSQENSGINGLRAELDALKQGIDQKFDQRFLEKDTAAEKQVLSEMKREAESLIRSQSDDYELVRENRQVPNVMKLIERTYKETGEVLDVPEALKLVEDELLKDALKLASFKKVQSQISPMTQRVPPQQRYQGMRTLTNKNTASVPMSARARAMAAFYGTLKR